MRFLRILPLVCARIWCSLSSFTRNMALGSSSVTVPLNSIMSSLGIRPRSMVDWGMVRWRRGTWAPGCGWSSFALGGLALGAVAQAWVGQAERDAAGVGLQSLGLGEGHGGG